MKTDLFFRLTEATPCPSVFFRESAEVEGTVQELRQANVAVFEIDGGALSSEEELFRAFATALRMPKGWYGDEEYACNANAFLEYLDDVTGVGSGEGPCRLDSRFGKALAGKRTSGR